MSNTPTAADELRKRINANWPTEIRSISTTALAAFDAFAERRATVDTSKADWIEATRKAAVPSGKAVAKAVRDLDRARAKLAADRVAVRTKALMHPSSRDAEIAGEIRAHLRGLNQGEAQRLLLGETADPAAQRALLEAPAYLVPGLSADFRAAVESDFLGKIAPDEIGALAATDDALHHAEVAVKLARDSIQSAAFNHEAEFEEWFETECQPDTAADDIEAQRRQAEADRLAAVDARLAELVAA